MKTIKIIFGVVLGALFVLMTNSCKKHQPLHDLETEQALVEQELIPIENHHIEKGDKKRNVAQVHSAKHAVDNHWGYGLNRGPASWGMINPDYALCFKGQNQSPIDLKWRPQRKGNKLDFHYTHSTLKIVDNGHTIQANFDEGSFVKIKGKKYSLLQLHFHSESEHTIGGTSYPMEMHLVHKDKKGHLAVIGVVLKEGKTPHPMIQQIWNHFPTKKNKEVVVKTVSFNAKSLLPDVKTYYHYTGSLTTPPCSEGVSWNVLNTSIEVSKKQIETFRKLYANTNRPIQAQNGRRVVNY